MSQMLNFEEQQVNKQNKNHFCTHYKPNLTKQAKGN